METQKIQNLQQKSGILLIVNQMVIIQKIKFLTRSIESNLCNYSDAYILVTGNINVTGGDSNTKVAFKNFAPFRKCRTEINKLLLMMQILLILQCLCTI